MSAVSDHAFYRGLGRFLSAWLDMDMDRLGVVPLVVEDVDGIAGDAVPIPEPTVGWDDLSCGGVV